MLPSVHGTSFHMGFIFDVCVFPCYFPTDPVSYAEVLLKLKSQTPQFKVSLLVHGTSFHMGFIFDVCVFPCYFPHRPSVLCRGPAETEVSDSTVQSVTFSARDQLSHGVYFWCVFFPVISPQTQCPMRRACWSWSRSTGWSRPTWRTSWMASMPSSWCSCGSSWRKAPTASWVRWRGRPSWDCRQKVSVTASLGFCCCCLFSLFLFWGQHHSLFFFFFLFWGQHHSLFFFFFLFWGQHHSLFFFFFLFWGQHHSLFFFFFLFWGQHHSLFFFFFLFLRSVAQPLLFCFFSSLFLTSASQPLFLFVLRSASQPSFSTFFLFLFLFFFFFVEVSITVSVYFILF